MYLYELSGTTRIPVFRASRPSDSPSNASPLAVGYVVAVQAEALAVDVRSTTPLAPAVHLSNNLNARSGRADQTAAGAIRTAAIELLR
jgi:hypothetical protein